MRRLDAFHLKGLRKILDMTITYVNRANSSRVVFQRANAIVNPNTSTAAVSEITPHTYLASRKPCLSKSFDHIF
jgi:hypothetical protein